MRDEVETTPAAGRGRTFSKGYAACSFSPAIARRGSNNDGISIEIETSLQDSPLQVFFFLSARPGAYLPGSLCLMQVMTSLGGG